MKIGTILCAIAALALCAGMVSADPFNVKEKPNWTYPSGWFDGRNEFPEVEPNDDCPGTQTIACDDIVNPANLTAGDHDFYPFTLTQTTSVKLGTLEAHPDSVNANDTKLEVWTGDCLTSLAYNDDGPVGWYSEIIIVLEPGDYVAEVYGYSSYTAGDYLLFMECTIPEPPPENDTCADAEQFDYFIERCTTGNMTGSTADAMNDYNPGVPGPSCTGWSANGKDVAFYMDLEAGDVVSMTYTQLNADASFYIVTDCGDMTSCVVGADGTYFADPEVIYWLVPASARYYLILDAYSTDSGGDWTLDYSITCPEPTPTQSTTWGQIKSMY